MKKELFLYLKLFEENIQFFNLEYWDNGSEITFMLAKSYEIAANMTSTNRVKFHDNC